MATHPNNNNDDLIPTTSEDAPFPPYSPTFPWLVRWLQDAPSLHGKLVKLEALLAHIRNLPSNDNNDLAHLEDQFAALHELLEDKVHQVALLKLEYTKTHTQWHAQIRHAKAHMAQRQVQLTRAEATIAAHTMTLDRVTQHFVDAPLKTQAMQHEAARALDQSKAAIRNATAIMEQARTAIQLHHVLIQKARAQLEQTHAVVQAVVDQAAQAFFGFLAYAYSFLPQTAAAA